MLSDAPPPDDMHGWPPNQIQAYGEDCGELPKVARAVSHDDRLTEVATLGEGKFAMRLVVEEESGAFGLALVSCERSDPGKPLTTEEEMLLTPDKASIYIRFLSIDAAHRMVDSILDIADYAARKEE